MMFVGLNSIPCAISDPRIHDAEIGKVNGVPEML
jgi:hypothetical protein